jgi:hypothetical protein
MNLPRKKKRNVPRTTTDHDEEGQKKKRKKHGQRPRTGRSEGKTTLKKKEK